MPQAGLRRHADFQDGIMQIPPLPGLNADQGHLCPLFQRHGMARVEGDGGLRLAKRDQQDMTSLFPAGTCN